MVEPRDRKCTQPFSGLGLTSDQDDFLTFGVTGFCHVCRSLDQHVKKALQPLTHATGRFTEVGKGSLVYMPARRLGRLDEAIRPQHAVERLCDRAAIGCLLSQHDDELFIIDQDR